MPLTTDTAGKYLQVRTIAAIIIWVAVILLFLNRAYKTEWLTPLAIVLTLGAVVVYFSPRLRKQKPSNQKTQA
ncbi:MAG: hypothetical protein CW691_02255 [Candidatus Bathyarchaeum sp.]|nr:MAG: hypothetical protein CW691_02255 [Candidatus Bathyarchaeum sp.]